MMEWKRRTKILIDNLYRKGFLFDPMVADAFLKVPIQLFISEENSELFFEDEPSIFAEGVFGHRPLAAPHMMAIMLQFLNFDMNSKVLQLGSMSGYFASLISEIAQDGSIYLIEGETKIAEITRHNLIRSGYKKKVTVVTRDPLEGLSERAPWDRIVVCGALPKIPQNILRQMNEKRSMLLCPMGSEVKNQELMKILVNSGKEKFESCGQVSFIPLPSRSLIKLEAPRLKRVTKKPEVETLFKEKYPHQIQEFKKGINIPEPLIEDLKDAYKLCEEKYYKAAIAMACVVAEGTLRCLYEKTIKERENVDKWTIPKFMEKLGEIQVLSPYSKTSLKHLNELRKYAVHYKPQPLPRIDMQAHMAVNIAKWFVECAFMYCRPSL